MTKTQLLKHDREIIRDALIAHKFGPVERALCAEENALAAEVRAFTHSGHLNMMARAPKGAFKTQSHIQIAVDGKWINLNFGAPFPNTKNERLFYNHESKFTSAEPLMARVVAWADKARITKDEKRALAERTLGTLSAYRNFDALLEAWPEAERFITEQWRKRSGSTARQLPVALGKLSEALDLPPDDAAESAAA